MGIELHTKFRILHAALSLLAIIILGVLGSNNLPEGQSLPWNFITPLTLLILGFLLSLAFCIVRIVIRVNFPVVGFAAHGISGLFYFAAAVILVYCVTADESSQLFVAKAREHQAGTCENFSFSHEICKANWKTCDEFVKYCKDRNDRIMRGGVLEPDLSPKSMIIVDIVIAFVCMMIALIGSYFAYEDYQDSEYEDEDEHLEPHPNPNGPTHAHAADGANRRTYTIGRNYTVDSNGAGVRGAAGFDHQPKPSQMV